MSEVHGEIREEIEKMNLPQGYSFFWDSQYKDQTEGLQALVKFFPLAFLICGYSHVEVTCWVTCDKGADFSPFQTEKSPNEWGSLIPLVSDFNKTGTFFSSSR